MITSKHVLSATHCFKIDSNFVRLGAHYLSKDKNYVDVNIDLIETHENFETTTKINDIAIVHLARDVEFTGQLKIFVFGIFFEKNLISRKLLFPFDADRIRPICLPTSEDMQNRNYVGNMPFVGKYYLIFISFHFFYNFVFIFLFVQPDGVA